MKYMRAYSKGFFKIFLTPANVIHTVRCVEDLDAKLLYTESNSLGTHTLIFAVPEDNCNKFEHVVEERNNHKLTSCVVEPEQIF